MAEQQHPMAEQQVDVYLEIGKKRVIAGALEWPGWARAGADEAAAQQALLAYAPRYAQVLAHSKVKFKPPAADDAFAVAERLAGNATTDYGVPGMAPAADARPLDDGEAARLEAILRACWAALDAAVAGAQGKALRSGPRGGGRDLEKIVGHVLEAEAAYIEAAGRKFKPEAGADAAQQLAQTHQAVVDTMAASARGEIEPRGPRGGKRWSPRYLARRVAWHVLDHAWEIEDRVQS